MLDFLSLASTREEIYIGVLAGLKALGKRCTAYDTRRVFLRVGFYRMYDMQKLLRLQIETV